MNYKAQRGTFDILPEEEGIWNKVQQTCFETARLFGYRYIETPIFEESGLFERTVGEDTDIVEKEMYSFDDKGGDNISLRPENTAGVCRAFIENGLHNSTLPSRLFYYGPMFRYERPQSGRYRQFHQFGIECIGDDSPDVDFEVIKIAWDILRNLNFNNVLLKMMEYWDLFIIGGNWALAIYFLLRALRVGGIVWGIFIFWAILSIFLTTAVM